jgi:hypothetical protein
MKEDENLGHRTSEGFRLGQSRWRFPIFHPHPQIFFLATSTVRQEDIQATTKQG